MSKPSKASKPVTELVASLLRDAVPVFAQSATQPPTHSFTPVSGFSESDWARITGYACDHGLAGLVLQAVRRREIQIDAAHHTRLSESAAQITARNLHLRHHLERTLSALTDAGIEAMVLKGMALNHRIYDRLDLRPMTDVDLLFHPNDIHRACRVLEESGYIPGEPLLRGDFFPRFYYEREYRPADAPNVKFDVHARLFRPWRYRSVPAETIWQDVRSIELGDERAIVPGHAGMLLHLCVHASCHGASRLLWLLDIHRYVARFSTEIDWRAFVQNAEALNLTWPIRVALKAASWSFGPTAPDWVWERLRSTPVGWADRLALWQAPRDDGHPVSRLVVDALVGGSWGEQSAYLCAILFPQQAHMADIYKPRHPGWLACAHAWRFLRVGVRSLSRV